LDDSSRNSGIKNTTSHTLSSSQHCYGLIVQFSVAYCKLTKVAEEHTATIFSVEKFIDTSAGNTKAEGLKMFSYTFEQSVEKI
jgi:hypothetical protein